MTMLILQAIYFMLPAYVANMMPVLVQKIPFGGAPLDGGRTIRGKRILGDHKTYRGFLCGIAGAVATVFVQRAFFEEVKGISLISYGTASIIGTLSIGILFGAGALGGDALKSFFKRQFSIAPGRPWIPFDQLDFAIGAVLLVSIVYLPPLPHVIVILVATPLLHFFINLSAYWLGLKKVWW